MAAKNKAAKAAAAAQSATGNPYLQRIIQDEELRQNVVTAIEAGRKALGRLNNGKAPAKALVDDKKLHAELKRSAEALRDASAALREAPKRSTPKKRKGGIGRLLLLALVGGAVAIAVSEDLRNKLLDALFGAEEEFDYTSNTSPATPPPETAPTT